MKRAMQAITIKRVLVVLEGLLFHPMLLVVLYLSAVTGAEWQKQVTSEEILWYLYPFMFIAPTVLLTRKAVSLWWQGTRRTGGRGIAWVISVFAFLGLFTLWYLVIIYEIAQRTVSQ